MNSSPDKVIHEIHGFLRVFESGRCERLMGTDVAAAGIDSSTGVQSKDVVVYPETGLSARLYIPKITNQNKTLPVLVYFHGGGFVVESAFSPTYHSFLNLLVAEANIVVVSVDYRKAPESPLPTAYEDSWAAIEWVASNGGGQEPWLNDYADLKCLFLGGDSAGGNISHNMAIRIGLRNLSAIKLKGIVLIHAFFSGKEAIGAECHEHRRVKAFVDNLWLFVNPSSSGLDDPLVNPAMDPNLRALGCNRVLLCVAEKDILRDRGWYYQEVLGKSAWAGTIEVTEAKGEGHVFFLFDPFCDNSVAMRKRICSFINQIRSKV